MAVPSLDNEFMEYWSKLTVVQKQSLLSVIKSFVIPGEKISVEQYNMEVDEAITRVESGDFYNQEDVEGMAKGW